MFLHKPFLSDLKPENFLFLDKSNLMTLNVIDFGIAKKYKQGLERLKTKSGTVLFTFF